MSPRQRASTYLADPLLPLRRLLGVLMSTVADPANATKPDHQRGPRRSRDGWVPSNAYYLTKNFLSDPRAMELSVAERHCITVAAIFYADPNGLCWPSVREWAKKAGVGCSTVQNAIRKARALGLISVKSHGRKNGSQTSNSTTFAPELLDEHGGAQTPTMLIPAPPELLLGARDMQGRAQDLDPTVLIPAPPEQDLLSRTTIEPTTRGAHAHLTNGGVEGTAAATAQRSAQNWIDRNGAAPDVELRDVDAELDERVEKKGLDRQDADELRERWRAKYGTRVGPTVVLDEHFTRRGGDMTEELERLLDAVDLHAAG
jgi:helix-turn-helix protein